MSYDVTFYDFRGDRYTESISATSAAEAISTAQQVFPQIFRISGAKPSN